MFERYFLNLNRFLEAIWISWIDSLTLFFENWSIFGSYFLKIDRFFETICQKQFLHWWRYWCASCNSKSSRKFTQNSSKNHLCIDGDALAPPTRADAHAIKSSTSAARPAGDARPLRRRGRSCNGGGRCHRRGRETGRDAGFGQREPWPIARVRVAGQRKEFFFICFMFFVCFLCVCVEMNLNDLWMICTCINH